MATYSGTPATATSGQVISASFWNAEVRDVAAALTGAWNTYSPTLAQGTATSISYTATYCKFIRTGALVIASGYIQATAAGDAGNDITLTLPVTPAYSGSSFFVYGFGSVRDSSGAADYGSNVVSDAAGAMAWRRVDIDPGGLIGSSPSFAVASGDLFTWNITYEAA